MNDSEVKRDLERLKRDCEEAERFANHEWREGVLDLLKVPEGDLEEWVRRMILPHQLYELLSQELRLKPQPANDSGEETTPRNIILYGPPGTGKTYATFRRCVEICDGKENTEDMSKVRRRYGELVAEKRVEFVTFHQSYGYEEFVEGLRPDEDSAGVGFRLAATDGVLKRIAEHAQRERDLPHVLVIDEINRANISKVMGELVTLLEEDKREGAPHEIAVTLPHSQERFTLPANLYIIGTMNTADRSIALLDTALRRRFDFEELPPNPDLLSDDVEGIDLPTVLRTINDRLEWLIDRDHLIGHAWLMGAQTKADVDRVMRRKIIPLIAEYFYDDWEKVHAVLGNTDDFVKGEPLSPPPGIDDAGEDRYRWTVQEKFEEGAYDRLISGSVRRGMPRRYLAREEDLALLRGKLNVKRQLTHLAVRPDRLACRFDELSEDTPLNRVFKAAVIRLSSIARSAANTRRLAELTARFECVYNTPNPLRELVQLDRTNTAFHDLYRLARLFLAGDWQTTTGGRAEGFTLLFAMNRLFEEFIGQSLKRALATRSVYLQPREHCAVTSADGGLFYLRPDALIKEPTPIILDTKWKRLTREEKTLGVAESDIYQMLAYAQAYDASRLVLLYPWHKEIGGPGIISRDWKITGTSRQLDIATIDVGEPEQVVETLRHIVR